MRLGLLFLIAAAASAQPTSGTLVFFDRFEGTPGIISQHPPPLDASGAGWSVDGPGTPPVIQSLARAFESGSQTTALARAPGGDRTLTYTLRQPVGNTAAVTATTFLRYQDAQTYLALRLRWGPAPVAGQRGPDATLTLDRLDAGALVQRTPVGATPHSGYERPVRFDVDTSDGNVSVWADGQPLATVPEAWLPGATAFGFAFDHPPRPNGSSWGVVFDVAVTTPSPLPATICPGLRGWNAESCVRDAYTPLYTADYDAARDELFTWLWATPTNGFEHTVEGLYGGAVSSWRHDYALSPRTQVQDDGFNTEHVWPRSRGAQPDASTSHPAHNDLHHLAPTWGTFNTARSNRPYGDAFDHTSDTHTWLRARTTRYASEGPPSARPDYSRVEQDFLRQPDNGNGWKELAELGRFDVRHDKRGDVARMAAYFLTIYRIEAEDGDEGRAFINATLDVLLRWHLADPVDDAERTRNERIYRVQGNRNPFVLDASLLERTFYQGPDQPRSRDLWINEIHHSNDGPDTGEGVEIAGPAGTDLYGYRIWIYSGHGSLYTVDGGSSGRAPVIALRGSIDDEGGSLGAVWAPAERLRGGCQGLALTDPDNTLIEFVSYGGCQFNALEGPVYEAAAAVGAADPAHPDSLVWSTGIRGPRHSPAQSHRRVQEWSTLPVGHSLQLSGAGSTRPDFHWSGPLPHSRGRLNDYQAPAGAANRVSRWTAGDPVPIGLRAPTANLGHDDEAPGAHVLPLAHPASDTLALSLPSPNPTTRSTRFSLSAPTGATLDIVLLDALGRVIARPGILGGSVHIDTRSLAVGTYAVRVTAHRPGHAPQSLSRRFTVLR